ncbi:alcohol dehydrogenase PQQ-dependent, large subunit [Acidocella aminolytica 101 = DSM 11237]|jgi:PQQ-dependent dehydrogenase (methanol/ethanol family)|uniref:Alcohol dehydrogenase PQQ-dependent, large subunit n=2 Tax=Acidocella TaxID=50709 RepID=A0A0D6PJ13_9PROT|nr:alcohol dehydrogenase PQQ-dependent, large subunit [Acidocella aminolytica 101 = DSM 11237]GBQ40835.1 putative methanol dehydrogenase subunit 1 [Acidocella aminolytica 101 = DSM 11237]
MGVAYAAQPPENPGAETGGGQGAMQASVVTADMNVTDKMVEASPASGKNWLASGQGYSNQRFSVLKQINTKSISQLTPVAIAQTGYTASFETTPIVVNGVMFITTPMVNSKQALIAMNAVTGQTLWKYVYTDGLTQICCGPVNRGATVSNGNVYFLTVDNHLVDVDAKNGKEVWITKVADAQAGYSETMAPQVYDNQVIIGSAGGEWPIRGFIAAYDANTGKQNWRFNTTDSKKSWEGDSWKTGGGTVWTTPSIDPKLGLVIFSTGNPNPDLDGSKRLGDNLYTDSIVALHLKDGSLAWYYQEVKHDVWDYDAVSNVVLFNTMDHGKVVPAAGEAGKTAFFYIVNRETGKLIRRSEPFDMQKNMFTPPSKEGVQVLPGANGGTDWAPPAYSPLTHYIYIMGMNQLMTFKTDNNAGDIPGQIRLGSTFKNVDHGIQNGTFTAIDVNTGKIAWNDTVPQPTMGGALVTAGNVAFMGEGNGWFDAFNATTGKKIWHFYLGAGVNAPPVAYEVDGREYIAVASGGNFQMTYPLGDVVAIFALPKSST